MPLLSPNFPLYSVSGTPLNVLGEAELEVGQGIVSWWVIVEQISHDAILGADLLNRCIRDTRANVDFNRDTLVFLEPIASPLCTTCNGFRKLYFIYPFAELLRTYQDVFFKKGDKLQPCHLSSLIIDTGDSSPTFQRPYRTPSPREKY